MTMTINGSGTIGGLVAGGLPDATITQPDLAGNVAGNGPAFFVYRTGADQSISNVTNTVVIFNGTTFDTASAYSSGSGRFQPAVAGYYQINATLLLTGNGIIVASGDILKNGGPATRIATIGCTFTSTPVATSGSAVIFLNGSTDYVQINAYIQATSSQVINAGSTFSGALVRAA